MRLDTYTRIALNEAERGYYILFRKEYLYNMVALIKALEHIKRKLEGWGILGLEGEKFARNVDAVADDMILNKLMELVELTGADDDLNKLTVEIRLHGYPVKTQAADVFSEDRNNVLRRKSFILIDRREKVLKEVALHDLYVPWAYFRVAFSLLLQAALGITLLLSLN